jgi:hypothetical protein
MKKTNWLLTAILFAILVSCSGAHKTKNNDIPELEKGKVIPSVGCLKDLSHTYALYIPSKYSAEIKYSLIICFDAHGSGVKPVELFKEQAEKYGYILAGSNVSKNGMPMQATFEHYDILLEDLFTRFNINKSRIYTCGFSGGSRVASSIAISKGSIAGVIGCSAGFPDIKDGSIKTKFDFFGYAGNDDMNYVEMVALDRNLEISGFRHQLFVFNGPHDWPPKEYIGESIIWTELNAMKDVKKITDKAFVDQQLSVFDQQLTAVQKTKNLYDEYLLTIKILNYFKGLTDTKKYEDQLAALEKMTQVQNALKKSEMDFNKEYTLQQKYTGKLSTENTAWWKAEVGKIDQFISNTKDESEKHLLTRVLKYLSLALYSNCAAMYGQGNYQDAEHYLELYALVDPGNSEPEFMWAQIFARKKDADKSLMHLKKAADLGFKENVRITNDTIFSKFNNDKRFSEIMNEITKNQNKP